VDERLIKIEIIDDRKVTVFLEENVRFMHSNIETREE